MCGRSSFATLRLDTNHGRHRIPCRWKRVVQIRFQDGTATKLGSSMGIVLSLTKVDKVLCFLLFIAGFKACSNHFGQSELLVFDGKDVVGSLCEDLRCYRCLTAHRIEGHQAALQLKKPKKMGNRCNRVGLCIRSKLAPSTM